MYDHQVLNRVSSSPLDKLPFDMFLAVFSFLDARDLCTCARLNKFYYNELCNHPILWRQLAAHVLHESIDRSVAADTLDKTVVEKLGYNPRSGSLIDLLNEDLLRQWNVDSFKDLYIIYDRFAPLLGCWRLTSTKRGEFLFIKMVDASFVACRVTGDEEDPLHNAETKFTISLPPPISRNSNNSSDLLSQMRIEFALNHDPRTGNWMRRAGRFVLTWPPPQHGNNNNNAKSRFDIVWREDYDSNNRNSNSNSNNKDTSSSSNYYNRSTTTQRQQQQVEQEQEEEPEEVEEEEDFDYEEEIDDDEFVDVFDIAYDEDDDEESEFEDEYEEYETDEQEEEHHHHHQDPFSFKLTYHRLEVAISDPRNREAVGLNSDHKLAVRPQQQQQQQAAGDGNDNEASIAAATAERRGNRDILTSLVAALSTVRGVPGPRPIPFFTSSPPAPAAAAEKTLQSTTSTTSTGSNKSTPAAHHHGHHPLVGLWKGSYGPHGTEIIHVMYFDGRLVGEKVTGDPNVPATKLSWYALVRRRDLTPTGSSASASASASESASASGEDSGGSSSSAEDADEEAFKEVQDLFERRRRQKQQQQQQQQQQGDHDDAEGEDDHLLDIDHYLLTLMTGRPIVARAATPDVLRYPGQGQIANHGYRSPSWQGGYLVVQDEDQFAFVWLPFFTIKYTRLGL